MDIKTEYSRWLSLATKDPDLIPELQGMDEAQIEDAFYRDLEFGTGGLRGTIGAGTNRMNVYIIAKASQGIANYINANYPEGKRSVAIGRDSRIKSDLFAYVTASVFAANGIKVYIYKDLNPVPTVSFAVRYLHTTVGVMVTASHNPCKYNGYKVYGEDGCQIKTEAADAIYAEIQKIDPFEAKMMDFEEGLASGIIEYIPDSCLTAFIENVKAQSLLQGADVDKSVSIVYSPLNGAGRVPVLRALKEMGYNNVHVVKEQEMPDGNFPTCPYPNPEIKEALALGLQYAEREGADLMIATDPDCDRVGIAVKAEIGEYALITGNEVGMLLLDYICARRTALLTMPKHPVAVKTIVSIDMATRIAEDYGVEMRDVLTGFKYIGEQIALLEKEGRRDDYIFGFEESYGYLTGTYVRDKDAVNAATMIVEMFAYYKSQGLSLIDKLHYLYNKYGYTKNTLHSYTFEGSAGFAKMNAIMDTLRTSIRTFGGRKALVVEDYLTGFNGLPKSNVLKFRLEGNISLVVRPSGTEPKLKLYVSVPASSMKEAGVICDELAKSFAKYLA